MTVTVAATSAGPFSPNGVTVNFDFDFKIGSTSEVTVWRRNTTTGVMTQVTTGFTVTLDSDGEGGRVTFATAPTSTAGTLYILSNPSFLQPANFSNSGFLPATLNPVFDQAAVRDLYLLDQIGRTVRVGPAQTGLTVPPTSNGDVVGTSNGNLVLLASGTFIGPQGNSAYQVAVANGFSGSEAAWLASLVGGSITGLATAADRTALSAISTSAAAAFLREPGREGLFKFDGSNLSSQVALDPGQGKYVPPASAPTGASGAWVRTDPSVKGSDLSYNGNAGGGDHALSLSKVGVVVAPDPAKAYMANIAEGGMVFWDDADGYYHMVFAAYSTVPAASVGHAKSLDLVTWTTDATALFSGSGTSGSPDQNGTSGPYIVKKNGTYYLFYIGLTATGYEGGEKSICLATATSLAGPWTRRGAVISKGAAGGATGWRSVAVWHPSIVQRGGTYYMFFNATGTGDKERIGYATSSDLLTWTVQDSTSPLIDVGAPGSWNSSISGDPSVYRDGDFWFMDFYGFNGTVAADGIAWTTDANFPLGWIQHPGNPLLVPDAAGGIDAVYSHKPFSYFKGGTKYHFYTAVGIYGRCVALAVAKPPTRPQVKISNMSHGNHELLQFYSNWYNGDVKGMVFRNQEDQVIGNMRLAFSGSQTYMTFGSFYNSGYGSADVVRIDWSGVSLTTGATYQVNGLKVVGARGAAVTDAVGAAGATPTQAEFNAFVAQFNALLARLRPTTGHGLIG